MRKKTFDLPKLLQVTKILDVQWFAASNYSSVWAVSIDRQERLTAAGLRCRQNFKYENVTSSFDYVEKNAPKGDAARLFFAIQPIKSLICSVVLAVAVVISQTP